MTAREFSGGTMPRWMLDDLVRAACGNTHDDAGYKLRAAPSAGATYPVEQYVVLDSVEDIEDGIYRYDIAGETLKMLRPGDSRKEIWRHSLEQDFILTSNAIFLMVYNPARIIGRYRDKSRDYALLECGHIAQNLLLMAAALELGNVPVGAFHEKELGNLLGIKGEREVLYMVCLGISHGDQPR
jgi:SagB-type dehydrogenase family enzyme